jgi:hypothetical protein
MPTYSNSGTLAVTTYDTRTLIDRAYGALGLKPEQITSEMQQIALDLLALLQNDMMNIGNPRWCVQQETVTLVQGQQKYTPPAGTHDLLSVFYRTVMPVTTQAISFLPSVTSYQYQFPASSPTPVSSVSINWTSASIQLSFQTSPDGVNWTTVGGSNKLTQNGILGVVWYDITSGSAAVYFRIVPTLVNSGAVLPSTSLVVVLANTPNDLECYRMNQNDFWNMTNKRFQGRPLQYWFDRQITPHFDVWPVPDAISAANYLSIWRVRQPLDVGTLQQTMELPPRWYWNMIIMLAAELGMCTPEAKPDKVALVLQRASAINLRTWTEERDKSPIKFQVNLREYTR